MSVKNGILSNFFLYNPLFENDLIYTIYSLIIRISRDGKFCTNYRVVQNFENSNYSGSYVHKVGENSFLVCV